MIKRFFAALLLFCLPLGAAAEEGDAAAARAVVDTLHGGIADMLKASAGLDFNGRVALLCPLLDEAMSVRRQAASAVGASAWNGWTFEQRDHYVGLYRDYLCALYADRFDKDSGQTFHIVGDRPGPRGAIVVLTEVHVPGDDPIDINYVMQRMSGAWKIIDLFLDGTVSEVALRRSEFSSLLRDRGYDGLMAAIAEKTASRAANTTP